MAVSLTDILDVEQLDNNLFRSKHHRESFRKSLFGGQVLAQGLMAAYHTVDGRLPHSLHAYFLRSGSSKTPVIYDIESLRDGRSISSRQVTARQAGRPIFKMLVSFQNDEPGFAHQFDIDEIPPSPEKIKKAQNYDRNINISIMNDPNSKIPTPPNFDFLPIDGDLFSTKRTPDARSKFWLKTLDTLPDSAIHHLCAAAFASDLGLLATSLLPHEASIFNENVWPASLDHALWFHDTSINTHAWHIYATDSPWAGHSRGFCRGSMYTREGKLVLSTTQEGLIRPLSTPTTIK